MIASIKSARRSELEAMLCTDDGFRTLYAIHKQLCPEMHLEYLKNGILFDYIVDDILTAESRGLVPATEQSAAVERQKMSWFAPHGVAASG